MRKQLLTLLGLICLPLLVSGCMRDMQEQPRYEPLEKSDFYENGQASRHFVEGTVAVGTLKHDSHLYEGKVDGKFAKSSPLRVTEVLLNRGEERFNIFCSVCHGKTGYGDGMVVQRGFPKPPTYHIERLRNIDDGYLFNVITNGFGKMSAYSDQINARDRWAIIAYIRALQLSQNIPAKQLSRQTLTLLNEPKVEEAHHEAAH
ncbi:MAG: mono/diheme cytochrome c family protein [Candidatus Omnitrophota bacterium]|jgi:mono/diheme cytochrome c family protein